MTEDEQIRATHEKLDTTLNKFVEEVREVIHRKVNDSINVDEVLGSDQQALHITLGWVQRIMFEVIGEDIGPEMVSHFFDNAYFQIGAMHIGPEDFSKVASPYRK